MRLFFSSVSAYCLALAAAVAPLRAQTTLVEEWRWVRFGVAEGLPSSIVHGLARAKDGTIWAATEAGAAWFDGYRWQAVLDLNGHPLPKGLTSYISVGTEGEVLFQSGPLVYRVASRGARALVLPPFPAGSWGSRVVAVGGEVWAVVRLREEWKLARYTRGAWSEQPWPDFAPGPGFDAQVNVNAGGRLLVSVGAALWERRGSGWVPIPPFTGGQGIVARFASTPAGEERLVLRSPDAVQGVWARGPSVGSTRWVKFPEFGREAPAAFDIGPDGSAVALLDAGDFLFCDTDGWRRLSAPSALGVATAAVFDADGDVWFSTRSGVLLWRRTSERWTQWRVGATDAINRVNGLAVAADGRVAAATGGGIAYLEADGLLHRDPQVPAVAFTAIAWGPGNHLWAGSGGGVAGVFERSPAGWRHRTDAPGLDSAGLHRIVAGRDGTLYLLGLPYGRNGRGGLWRVVRGVIERVALPAAAEGARFYDMTEDSTGTRWFATDHGLLRERDGQIAVIDISRQITGDTPFSVAVGDEGSLWVGMRALGLVRLRRDLTIEHPDSTEASPLGKVVLHRAQDGRLWATNPDGIWVRAGSSWSMLTGSFGLPTRAVWPLASLGGDIYVGTMGAGVLRLRLNGLAEARPRVSFRPPHDEDGVLTFQWSVATERGGVAPDDVVSRWRVDDGPWSSWSHATFAVSPVHLPWMRHSLWVEARTPLGVTTSQAARLDFVVPPPAWWRREVLVVIVSLLAVLTWLSVLLVRRRALQVTLARRVQEAERMELVGNFAAGMAHELNNLLTTITVNADLVDDTPGSGSPSPSDEIRRAALQAAAQLRSVLAFTRDRALVLADVDLAELLRQQQAPVSALFPSGIETRWHIPAEPVRVLAEPNAIAAILRALAENAGASMTNIGWFDVTLRVATLNARQCAELGVANAPHHAELVVSDSGVGMTAEQSLRLFEPSYPARDSAGRDLVLVQGLMRRFNGAVHIDASSIGGTTLHLYFPLAADVVA